MGNTCGVWLRQVTTGKAYGTSMSRSEGNWLLCHVLAAAAIKIRYTLSLLTRLCLYK